MLDKEKRICKSRDFKNSYKIGKKIPGRYIIVFVTGNKLGCNRFGIVTSKKVGKAVVRNKAKRQIRAIINNQEKQIKTGYDIVIVVRQKITAAVFALIEKDFRIVMRKANLC